MMNVELGQREKRQKHIEFFLLIKKALFTYNMYKWQAMPEDAWSPGPGGQGVQTYVEITPQPHLRPPDPEGRGHRRQWYDPKSDKLNNPQSGLSQRRSYWE